MIDLRKGFHVMSKKRGNKKNASRALKLNKPHNMNFIRAVFAAEVENRI